MNKLTEDMFFNDSTVNIFTDASITRYCQETIGCAGNNIMVGNMIVAQPMWIIRNTTNNNSEITAILMAVMNALKYKDTHRINIFSDSKICVFGLKDWIYKWVRNVTPDGIMISSQGKPVANQDIILRIIYFILQHNLYVNLYHVNGHINPNNISQLEEAKKTFMVSNNIRGDIDLELIKKLETGNAIVDKITRDKLTESVYDEAEPGFSFIDYNPNLIDIREYSKLIGG